MHICTFLRSFIRYWIYHILCEIIIYPVSNCAATYRYNGCCNKTRTQKFRKNVYETEYSCDKLDHAEDHAIWPAMDTTSRRIKYQKIVKLIHFFLSSYHRAHWQMRQHLLQRNTDIHYPSRLWGKIWAKCLHAGLISVDNEPLKDRSFSLPPLPRGTSAHSHNFFFP